MYNIYNTVSDLIVDVDLAVGDSKRVNCPNCGGIKTFTITNSEGKLLWNCYKASCNVKEQHECLCLWMTYVPS